VTKTPETGTTRANDRGIYICVCVCVLQFSIPLFDKKTYIYIYKKQLVVARSSVEAEFGAMVHGICELLWLKILLKELG